MIADLTLPRLGETMETGRVAAWLKQPGDSFKRGETLVEIESDKTVVEMPALADGVLREIVVEAGQDADVGAVLCRYEDGRGEAAPPQAPGGVAGARVADVPPPAPPEPVAEQPSAPPTPTVLPPTEGEAGALRETHPGALRATPLARAVARQNNVVLAEVPGTGPRGRIEADDVRARTRRDVPAATVHAGAVPDGHVERRDWTPSHAVGPRIVLLHGLAADLQSWAVLAAALARSGRPVTAIDLPGHGGTTIEAVDVDDMAAVVAAFLDRLGDERVELVGHSLGGAVAARAARLRPERLSRLTLLAPAGLDRPIDVDFIRSIVRAGSPGALSHLLRRLVVRPAAPTSEQLAALVAELERGRLVAMADSLVDDGGQLVDITGDLRALRVPVRVVWGLQDRIIPWTEVREAGSRCAVHLIADAGHVPHWDQPAEVAALFS